MTPDTWSAPRIVVVLPKGTVSVAIPYTEAGWEATTRFLAEVADVSANRPLGAVVQTSNRPALRSRRQPPAPTV
jgi:hypothetical protein